MEKLISLNEKNIENEHICCAFANKKTEEGYEAKKSLIMKRFKDGYKFKKFDIRGKVFIEYGPAEKCWFPIDAPGYNFIQCFWVAGKFQKQGYGKKLIEEAIKDSKDTNGLVILSSKKKKPFLSDGKFLKKYGFEVCDTAHDYFELLVKRNNGAPLPKIKDCAKNGKIKSDKDFQIVYSELCPFTGYYSEEIMQTIMNKGYSVELIKLDTVKKGMSAPTPFPIFSIFYRGEFISHELMSEKGTIKFIDKFFAEGK